jgi:tryptophan-rich sensory protein
MRERIREAVDGAAQARSAAARHVGAGLALAGGAVLLSALVAGGQKRRARQNGIDLHGEGSRPAVFEPPKALSGVFWPPLFIALTLSGLRLWNAPSSAGRTRALTLWTAIQGLNAVWMSLGPARLGGKLTAAVATLGTALAYAFQARQIDAPASTLAAPYLGWMGLANVLTEQLWRRAPASVTLH